MKHLCSSALIIFVLGNSMAQDFCFRVGATSSRFEAKDTIHSGNDINEQYNFKPGIEAGLLMNFSKNKIFEFSTGILYKQKGANYKRLFENGPYKEKEEYDLTLSYLELPFQFNIGWHFKKTRIYGLLGGVFDIGLFAKSKYELTLANSINGQIITGTINDEDFYSFGKRSEDTFHRLDFGIMPGIGMKIGDFQIELSYTLGLINILNSETLNPLRNRSFSLSLGYLIRNKKKHEDS